MFPRFVFFLFFLSFSIADWAQNPLQASEQADSARLLPAVEVIERPLRSYLTGSQNENWTPADLEKFSGGRLSDLLEQESGVFVKSYGLGSSATTSIRGGAAGHTSVLWNGLPLQSPMLGQLDFSLLPLSLIDNVQLTYGGNTAAWGSGAVGGLIGLENQADFEEQTLFSFHSAFGSFGLSDQQLKTQFGKDNWRAALRFFHQQADNDFTYRLRSDLPLKKQTHAAFQQTGVLPELYWRPAPGRQLVLRLWLQQTEREIPPTSVQNRSAASQEDQFIRAALHWKSVGKKLVWQARSGLFRESLDYRDELIGLQSLSYYWTATAEVEGEWYLNARRRLHFGLGHTWLQAEADAYKKKPQQHRVAPFVAFRNQFGRWQMQVNLRQEIVDGRLAPLVPAFGLEGELNEWLSLRAKITRNYRLPTFNDLYWRPGGNPDLLPESGWSQEAALNLRWKRTESQWTYSLAGFNRHIDNWILWSPREGQFFWSPHNIAKVWSRGLEQRLNWFFTTEKWTLQLSGGYDYILSTNEIAIDNPRLAAGEQLAYVPRRQAFGKLHFKWKNLEIGYRHRYTGSVGALNIDSLPGYQLGYFSFSYAFERSWWKARFFLNVNNIWNANYRVIERRPMPGRYIQAGVRAQFTARAKSSITPPANTT